MRKPTICIGENTDADQLRDNREADQRLCFRYKDSTLPLLLYLNPKFKPSSLLLCLYSSVCVGPVLKPHCWFSPRDGSIISKTKSLSISGICAQPLNTGSGSQSIERFYYDTGTDTCKTFTYKGTLGNENNFKSLLACSLRCRPFSADGQTALKSKLCFASHLLERKLMNYLLLFLFELSSVRC